MDILSEVKEKNEDRLMDKKNVVGVCTGKKEIRGEETDEDAIIVLVRRKEPEYSIKTKDRVPRQIAGVNTDVIEVGDIHALQRRTDKWRPAPGGVSVGHVDITAGTLGCLVSSDKREVMILSNCHVLANSNKGKKGDPILQPGPHDGGENPDDKIGELGRYVKIHFVGAGDNSCPVSKGVVKVLNGISRLLRRKSRFKLTKKTEKNEVDCAVAYTSTEVVKAEVLGIGVPKGTVSAKVGDKVEKSGRTTGHTRDGKVKSIDATIRVSYGSQGVAVFKNQILVKSKDRFSKGGDSGSVVFRQNTNKSVGLLFAGNRDGTQTFCNHIGKVEKELGVKV